MKITLSSVLSAIRLGLSQKEKVDKANALAKKEAKKEAERKKSEARIERYRQAHYTLVKPGTFAAETYDGISVYITKSKSDMWWVRAFQGDVTSRSAHGYLSEDIAMREAPHCINRVAVKLGLD